MRVSVRDSVTSYLLLNLGVLTTLGACTPPPSDESGDTSAPTGSGGNSSEGGAPGEQHELPAVLSRCPDTPLYNDAGQELVFCDDFLGDGLDRDVWSTELGMVRNHEEQCYLDREQNIVVSGGFLELVAIPETVDDPLCSRMWDDDDPGPTKAGYSSASILTRDAQYFTYGRFEARLKVPSATGAWPAFWLRPQENVYGGWPTSGEIDVMEYVSQTPNLFYGTVHYDFLGHEENGSSHDLGFSVSDDFHVVAIEWTPLSMDWYVDGTHFHSFDSSRDIQGRRPFDEAFFLTLNFAVGGTWPEDPDPQDYPAKFIVDWVRVYQDITQ